MHEHDGRDGGREAGILETLLGRLVRRPRSATAERPRRVYPLPEIIAPGSWVIRELLAGGYTVPAAGILAAPLDDTPFACAIRAHELAHVRWSPPRPQLRRQRVQLQSLLAAEDARVNELARRTGLGAVLDELDDPGQPPPDPRTNLRTATLILVAAHGTGAFDRFAAAYDRCGEQGRAACRLARRAVRVLSARRHAPKFWLAVKVARMLDAALGPPQPGLRPHVCPTSLLGVADRDELVLDDLTLGEEDEGEAGASGRGGGLLRWGELRAIEQPARSIPCGRMVRMTVRFADEGTMLRAPHRLLVDGRVFACRRRARGCGGTVLIDASGSMHLGAGDLAAILRAAEGAQVACYDGHREGWGALRILARDGRRVADDLIAPPTGGGGNVVDGPALRWLAAQPPPRVWVTDGMVTGVGDTGSRLLAHEAETICRDAAIARVGGVEEVVAALRREV